MNRVVDITKKMVWGLAALSITSCLIRNDYNVLFSFFILIILNNFYNNNPKLFIKIIIQTLGVLCIADTVWIIVIMCTWTHPTGDKSEYWSSLSGIHTFGIIFAFLELILKGLIVAYLINDFKQKNPEEMKELLKFTYLENLGSGQKKTAATSATVDMGQANKMQAEVDIGGDSDFKNPY